MSIKYPNDAFRLATQCLNQLRHSVPLSALKVTLNSVTEQDLM
jgi:hypothetical protein